MDAQAANPQETAVIEEVTEISSLSMNNIGYALFHYKTLQGIKLFRQMVNYDGSLQQGYEISTLAPRRFPAVVSMDWTSRKIIDTEGRAVSVGVNESVGGGFVASYFRVDSITAVEMTGEFVTKLGDSTLISPSDASGVSRIRAPILIPLYVGDNRLFSLDGNNKKIEWSFTFFDSKNEVRRQYVLSETIPLQR